MIKSSCPKYRVLLINCHHHHHHVSWLWAKSSRHLSHPLLGTVNRRFDECVRWTISAKSWFRADTKISWSVRHWIPFEKITQYTRRLRLYELRRKEPLYNPRWPPPWRGLLLANTKQEAPPWLTARDGMIYWDFCLFALRYNEHIVPSSPRW